MSTLLKKVAALLGDPDRFTGAEDFVTSLAQGGALHHDQCSLLDADQPMLHFTRPMHWYLQHAEGFCQRCARHLVFDGLGLEGWLAAATQAQAAYELEAASIGGPRDSVATILDPERASYRPFYRAFSDSRPGFWDWFSPLQGVAELNYAEESELLRTTLLADLKAHAARTAVSIAASPHLPESTARDLERAVDAARLDLASSSDLVLVRTPSLGRSTADRMLLPFVIGELDSTDAFPLLPDTLVQAPQAVFSAFAHLTRRIKHHHVLDHVLTPTPLLDAELEALLVLGAPDGLARALEVVRALV